MHTWYLLNNSVIISDMFHLIIWRRGESVVICRKLLDIRSSSSYIGVLSEVRLRGIITNNHYYFTYSSTIRNALKWQAEVSFIILDYFTFEYSKTRRLEEETF